MKIETFSIDDLDFTSEKDQQTAWFRLFNSHTKWLSDLIKTLGDEPDEETRKLIIVLKGLRSVLQVRPNGEDTVRNYVIHHAQCDASTTVTRIKDVINEPFALSEE